MKPAQRWFSTLASVPDACLTRQLAITSEVTVSLFGVAIAANKRPILTIGYGLRPIDEIVAVLHRHGVDYVGDVRSVPFSRRRPEFSRPALEQTLREHGICYVFLGDLLGGRPDEPSCYDDEGHVDYDRCRASDVFATGLDRVETAYREEHPLALLCSEARPEDCHRSKLLAEMLIEREVPVCHIGASGELVEHREVAAKLRGPQMSLMAEGLGRSRRAYRAA
jgi:uncharacterized protein (DUF488 family)